MATFSTTVNRVLFTDTDEGAVTFTAAIAGPQGATGPGVPDGGTTGQSLTKASNADQDTEWATVAGGGGTGVTLVQTFHVDPAPFTGVLDQSAFGGPTLVDGDSILCVDDLTIRTYDSAGTWATDHAVAAGEVVLIGYTGYTGAYAYYDMALFALDEAGVLAQVAEGLGAAAIAAIGSITAGDVAVNAAGFDGNLDTGDTTVQAVAQKVDDLTLGGGSGDVVGPASSVDGRAVLFDGTTGKLVKQASAAPMLVGDAPTAHVHAGTDITTGLVAASVLGTGTANSTVFLRGDQTWATPAGGGSGDVVGPSSSVDGRAVLFDSTTGKLIKQASAAPMLVETATDFPAVIPNTTDNAFIQAGTGSGASVTTTVTATAITLLRTCTVSQVSVYVNAGGNTGHKVGIAIYNSAANGRPGTLLYDCGSVLCESSGRKTITLGANQQLGPGLWWFATTNNTDTGTDATLFGYASGTSGGIGNRGASPDNQLRNGSYSFTTTGGAFTSSPTWTLGLSSGAITANIGITFTSVP